MSARCRVGVLLAAMPLLLSACGTLDFSPGSPVTRERSVEAPANLSRESVRQKLKVLLEAEEYRSALILLRREIDGGRPESTFSGEYVCALNGLLEAAEEQSSRGASEKAGALFQTARQGFPNTEAVAARVKLSPAEIRVRINESAEQLMERGLVAYRTGDLDGAIRTWRMIQTFHPGHPASQRALETAEIQRRNLEKVPPPLK